MRQIMYEWTTILVSACRISSISIVNLTTRCDVYGGSFGCVIGRFGFTITNHISSRPFTIHYFYTHILHVPGLSARGS
jgi:hypothetical protein